MLKESGSLYFALVSLRRWRGPFSAHRRRAAQGHRDREEGEARSQEKGVASCHRSPAQAMTQKGRRLHVLRRYH